MPVQRVLPLSEQLPGTHKRGMAPIADANGKYRQRYTYLDARDYGIKFDGQSDGSGTDSTTALQAAINDTDQDQPCIIGYDPKSHGYTGRLILSNTITLKTGLVLRSLAPSSMGAGAVWINFWGADAADCFATPASSNFSRIDIQGLQIRDMRTNPARTGRAIVIDNAFNGIMLKHLSIYGFYDNIYVGATSSSRNSDCIHIEDVFVTNFLRYGIRLDRVANFVLLEAIGGDTSAATALALINISNTHGGMGSVALHGIKHENEVATCDTLLVTGDCTGTVSGISMRGSATALGGSVVHFTGHGGGWTVMGVTCNNTAFGDTNTNATNLLKCDSTGVAIAPSSTTRSIMKWVGGPITASHQGEWINGSKEMSGTGTPEGTITAPVGSLWRRQDGASGSTLYIKESGTGNTGWRAVPTILTGSKTHDWASLADGTQATTTVTVTGAVLGDQAVASLPWDLQGLQMWAYVSAADTVTVALRNGTGSAVDLASGTLRVTVTKRL